MFKVGARVVFCVSLLEDALFSVILSFNAGGETNTSVAVDTLSFSSANPAAPSDSL